MPNEVPPELDLRLVEGFDFTCRPDCGLCCYAEPRVEPDEEGKLLQIAPSVRITGRGRDRFLAARADGGACQFLREHRCIVHAVRPHPCREFPITVHVGSRLQATVVLSCPGVGLGRILGTSPTPRRRATDFDSELASVRERIGEGVRARLEATGRRGRQVERALRETDQWDDPDDLRASLRRAIPRPTDREFPVEDPPEPDEGRENLPLFFDGRPGPLALGRGLGGWVVEELRPTGGSEPLGVFPPPDRAPATTPEASRLLDGYLRYVLERDGFLAAVHLDALEAGQGRVLDWAREELAALGAIVLARGAVRAKLHGGDGLRLSVDDVANGIRATDMDWLDRPGWGDRL